MFCPASASQTVFNCEWMKNIQILFDSQHKSRRQQQTVKCLIKNMNPLQNCVLSYFSVTCCCCHKKDETGVSQIVFQKYNAKYWLDIESYCHF